MNNQTPSVTAKQLSDWGLIAKINNEILHPLGLALAYEVDNPSKVSFLIADDYKWSYGDESTIERNKEKFEAFMKDRETILNKAIENFKLSNKLTFIVPGEYNTAEGTIECEKSNAH